MPPSDARPNILLVMFDQMAALSLPVYGHPVVQAPNLTRLAARGTVFESAYCASPLCSPARFAMLTGRLPSRFGAYDNAAELPAGVPTVLHHLRKAGVKVAGFSIITNLGAGMGDAPLSHEQTMTMAASAAGALRRLLNRMIADWDA